MARTSRLSIILACACRWTPAVALHSRRIHGPSATHRVPFLPFPVHRRDIVGLGLALPFALAEGGRALPVMADTSVSAGGARKKKAILALDGGGTRGIITACVLKVLEDELQSQGKPPLIGDAFDVIAGTSTGSLLATYLTASACETVIQPPTAFGIPLNGEAQSAIELYEKLSREIFPQSFRIPGSNTLWAAKHAPTGVEDALQEAFKDATFQDLATVKKDAATLFVTAFDMVYRRPVAFVGGAGPTHGGFRFLRLDPFTLPFEAGDPRRAQLETQLNSMPPGYGDVFGPSPEAMNLFNVGDAGVLTGLNARGDGGGDSSGEVTRTVFQTKDKVALWEACRCSTAAPTYFPPAEIEDFYGRHNPLVACDGGVVANNPAEQALNYVQARDNVKVKDCVVLSIGCGAAFVGQSPEKARGYRSQLDWIKPPAGLVNILMNSGSAIAHFNLDNLFRASGVQDQYLRIQVAADAAARSPGAGYADPEVLRVLNAIDEPEDMDQLKHIGEALGALYKPLIKKFVHDYL